MNQGKKAWEAPALRTEKVQETLARPACRVKIKVEVTRPNQHGVFAQALFS